MCCTKHAIKYIHRKFECQVNFPAGSCPGLVPTRAKGPSVSCPQLPTAFIQSMAPNPKAAWANPLINNPTFHGFRLCYLLSFFMIGYYEKRARTP
jgi:hypothetical protein